MIKELNQIQFELKAPKDKRNDFGKYNYRSCEGILEAVKPILEKHNCTLTLSDDVMSVGSQIFVKATATITNADGDSVSTNAFAMHDLSKKGMDLSQITGSASSYARKYALNGLFCIDDNKDADTNEHHNEAAAAKEQYERNVQTIIGYVNAAKSLGELQSIWNANAAFQTDTRFSDAVNAMVAKFNEASAADDKQLKLLIAKAAMCASFDELKELKASAPAELQNNKQLREALNARCSQLKQTA